MNKATKPAPIAMETPLEDAQAYFPIRILAEKTHVGTSTLRAWERRYGLLTPERTPKGHRLYSHRDVQRVLKILNLLKDGHSLPEISELLSVEDIGSANKIAESDNTAKHSETSLTSIWTNFVHKTLDAVEDFSSERIDAIYNEASSLYPIDMVTEQLIEPVLDILGQQWRSDPQTGIAREHFYSSWLKNRLGARFHHAYAQARGARIICACAPGCYHEIGLMLFALTALARGYRVLYFGSDLPLEQLHYIAQRSAAKAVVLSVQNTTTANLDQDLPVLLGTLKVPVFVGGNYAQLDTEAFQAAGGILLGNRAAIAINIFERKIPPFSKSEHS